MSIRDPKTVVFAVLPFVLAILAYSAVHSRFTSPGRWALAAGAERGHNPELPGPQIAGCPLFPADSVWSAPIDKLPKDHHSDVYISMMSPERTVHPDFSSNQNYGVPINIIPGTMKRVGVEFETRDESDLGNYPIPPDVQIEGGSSSQGGDRHILLIDKDRCLLFELFGAESQKDGGWKAGSGIKMDLTDNALRGEGKTSADASGLPILPGLVRYDEVAAGEIKHALRFTTPKTQRAYVWPARHFASRLTDPTYPPMGMRFRLRADYDLTGFSKPNQVILTALKRYGMILADNGGPWFVTGSPDPRWDDRDLHKLGKVKGSDFEAVDESDWQILADSGRVDPLRTR
jgi:hypothetical protein